MQNRTGKKFRPGDLVYIRCHFKPHAIGLICKSIGTIENSKKIVQEVYRVLVGRDLMIYNEIYLYPLNNETIKNYIGKKKN